MTWAFAIFACFTVLIVAAFALLLTIYIKEYNREEKSIQEYLKHKEQYMKSLAKEMTPLYYLVSQPPPPKKKAKAPEAPPVIKTDKNKKDIN